MKVYSADVYRKAAAAEALTNRVDCGPEGDSCDYAYRCAAHGGEHEDETPAQKEAREQWESMWRDEVASA